MNQLMIGAYILVILIFGYLLFFRSKGIPVNIQLYRWVNRKRIFQGEVKGQIKKRYPDASEEMLVFRSNRKQIWSHVPDNNFFMTNFKGIYVLHIVLDANGNVNFIEPNDTIYNKKIAKFKEPVIDKDGKKVYENVYVRDENGNLKLEVAKDEKGKPIYSPDGSPVMQPITEKRQKYIIIEREIEEPSSFDHVIESDRKLYYLNKKEEIRQKFKREEKKSLWQTLAPMALIGLIVIATVYLSYKNMQEVAKELGQIEKEFKPFLQVLVEQSIQNKQPDKAGDPKPDNYGDPVPG